MICVLQFDAASVAVVDRMLAAGRLPALAGLIERGERMALQTPADHFAAGPSTRSTAGSSWPTTASSIPSSGMPPSSAHAI